MDEIWRGAHAFEKRLVTGMFSRMVLRGALELQFDKTTRTVVGEGDAKISITPPRLIDLIKIIINPEFQAGETYIRQKWCMIRGDVIDLIFLFSLQKETLFRRWHIFVSSQINFTHVLNQYLLPKTQTRKTKNHYNLNTDIFQIIIGQSMVYSCAFFERETDSLEQAQMNKIHATIDHLLLPDDENITILDIGCGWGALAIEIAQKYPKAKVCGLSISKTQIDYAKRNVKENYPQLSDRVEFNLMDFDDLIGEKFDRIVSVGMLEHVGKNYLASFFERVRDFLNHDGLALIHCIISQHEAQKNVWIDRYVFTGAYVPKTSEVVRAVEHSDMTIKNMYFYEGENYRKTLECWLSNLRRNRLTFSNIVKNLLANSHLKPAEIDFESEKTYRIWEFYMSASQRMVRKDMLNNCVCQFQITKE